MIPTNTNFRKFKTSPRRQPPAKPIQPDLFAAGQDLPLFSGTAEKVWNPQFNPEAAAVRQPSLFSCPWCHDTGEVFSPKTSSFYPCACKDQHR